MNDDNSCRLDLKLPKGFIVFVSGVPGVGKTTISYELLKKFDEFRIVEETDLIREVIRGYNEYIKDSFETKDIDFLEEIEIAHSAKILRYDEAKKQCEHMKKSFEKIVGRQKRKGIATIINGVHIVPEILDGLCGNEDIIFVNLYMNNEHSLLDRWKERDPNKYNKQSSSIAFQTNEALSSSTKRLTEKHGNVFNDIDVTFLSVEETNAEIIKSLSIRLQSH